MLGLEGRGGLRRPGVEAYIADRNELASSQAFDEGAVVQQGRHAGQRCHVRPRPVSIDEEVATVMVDRPVADATGFQGRAENNSAFVARFGSTRGSSQAPRQVGQGLALRLPRLCLGDIAKVHRDAFRSGKRAHLVPARLVGVEGRERRLDARVHRPVITVPERRVFETGVDLPDDAPRERAGLDAEDAVGLRVHIVEAPVAVEREEAFADALQDVHRAAIGLDGRFLDPVHDVVDAAVVGQHRDIQGRPVPLFEAATLGCRATDVVADDRHAVGLARREDPIERRTKRAAADGFDVGVVWKDVEEWASHDRLVGMRRFKVRRACAKNPVLRVRAQQHERARCDAKQSLQVLAVEHMAARVMPMKGPRSRTVVQASSARIAAARAAT